MFPKDLRYLASHEWARIEGDTCTVGISKFAVEQLTDIVYVDLPDVGDHVFANESFGEVESVKSVNDLYAPVSGEVIAVNDPVVKDPATISADPYGKGWLVKLRMEPNSPNDKLLTAEKYEKQVASDSH